MTSKLKWISDERVEIEGVQFFATITDYERKSTPEEFVILKNRAMIEREFALIGSKRIDHILDIGIWHSGSVVLYDRAFRPQKLVAIEYNQEPINSPLRNYISQHNRTDNVKPYYWVNQGDADRMNAIMADEFGDQNIDLVIDDGSHYYEETRTSFNVVFPYLSPGAHYIIEDWGWAHSNSWTIEYFKNKPAQTNLIIELLALVVSRPDLLNKVEVFGDMAIVTKGTGEIKRGEFDLGEFATSRGRRIVELSDQVVELSAKNQHIEQIIADSTKERQVAVENLHQEVDTLRTENRAMQDRLDSLIGSTSWKITSPLRKIAKFTKYR